MEKKSILVSACLLGVPCRYDGQSKPCEDVLKLSERFNLIPVCPEVDGGLPTPRSASEVQPDGTVKNTHGEDVTANYLRGAENALQTANENDCHIAILKEKSPSCGKGRIYDGSFRRILTSGDGITVRMLLQNGVKVLGESEIAEFLCNGIV